MPAVSVMLLERGWYRRYCIFKTFKGKNSMVKEKMVICGNTCMQWHACCILALPIYKAMIYGKVSCLTENHETKAYWSILTIATIFSFCTVTIGRLL